MQFNKSQKVAILHRSGPALVLAGPGSGKTAVITYRIRELIHSGVPPESILVITFTRAAAGEMRERFSKTCDGVYLPVTFGTFHSIFFSILCKEAGLNQNSIISDNARYRVLKDILIQTSKRYDDEPGLVTALLDEISSIKAIGGFPTHYQSKTLSNNEIFDIFEAYQNELARERLVDFDDMLLMTERLFKRREDILRDWREHFKYILIDEFQDINQVQYDIVKLLAYPRNNLFVVGDDDQSIYGFRGSEPKFMLGFGEDYKDAKRILLNVNYRSTGRIVEMAGGLISHNKFRYKKTITAALKSISQSEAPIRREAMPTQVDSLKGARTATPFMIFNNVSEENDFIVAEIRRLNEAGVSLSQMAALFRTNRSMRALAERLARENIPFIQDSKAINIYEHWVAKDIFSYMRILDGGRDRGDFLRIINRPSRYVRRDCFDEELVNLDRLIATKRIGYEARQRLERLKLQIRRASGYAPYALISYIRNVIGYDKYIREYARKMNINADELLLVADEIQEASLDYMDTASWFSWVQKYSDEVFCFVSDKSIAEKEEAVRLMSMHRSKGLEFEAVFIPDANEGIVPYSKAKHEREVEEERRLFYVAMTRAKTRLYMLSTLQRFNKNYQPSRFLYEISDQR